MLAPEPASLSFRAARQDDARAIAGLHADSWRRHYRGAYSDSFLDDDALGYLLDLWTERMHTPNPTARTILAEQAGQLVGLAHTFLDEDPTWGAFLDNLHVAHRLKRRGIGARLITLTRDAVHSWSPASGLYLWVLEQNSAAQAFYTAQGGVCVERHQCPAPGGDPARLTGTPLSLRYTWPPTPPPPRPPGPPISACPHPGPAA